MRSIKDLIYSLSGGNQQKSIIARWLVKDMDILLFNEPTRGVDVGARAEIYRYLERLAKLGKCIVIISMDTTEILGVSDRIYPMYRGKIQGEFGKEIGEEKLLRVIQGGVQNEKTG